MRIQQEYRIPVNTINTVFIILAAITISLAIPIVGILLISALLVIPTIAALQFKKSFFPTILIAQVISIISVFLGIVISFYLSLATGGVIVLINVFIFIVVQIFTSK
jgi:zinc transport system permease protein